PPADLAAYAEGEPLRGGVVGSETTLEDQAPTVLEREAADLRRRGLCRPRQHLLKDLVQVERRGCGLQGFLEAAQLPDAPFVLLVELRVAHRDDALVAERGQDP